MKAVIKNSAQVPRLARYLQIKNPKSKSKNPCPINQGKPKPPEISLYFTFYHFFLMLKMKPDKETVRFLVTSVIVGDEAKGWLPECLPQRRKRETFTPIQVSKGF